MKKDKNEQLEEKVERNTKHIWWLTIVMVVLLVAAALGGYLAGASRIANEVVEKNGNIEEKTNEETVDFTIEEATKYINYIYPNSIGPADTIFNVKSIKAENLSVPEKLNYIGKYLYSKQQTSEDYSYSYLAENDVKKIMEEVYGPNTYKREKFSLGCGSYEYNESEGRFAARTGCGGTTATLVNNIVIDFKTTKNNLEITTAYAFHNGENNKIYKDYNKTIELGEYSGQNVEDYLANYIRENKDNLNHITYIFESEDGNNYYFKEFRNSI